MAFRRAFEIAVVFQAHFGMDVLRSRTEEVSFVVLDSLGIGVVIEIELIKNV